MNGGTIVFHSFVYSFNTYLLSYFVARPCSRLQGYRSKQNSQKRSLYSRREDNKISRLHTMLQSGECYREKQAGERMEQGRRVTILDRCVRQEGRHGQPGKGKIKLKGKNCPNSARLGGPMLRQQRLCRDMTSCLSGPGQIGPNQIPTWA